MKLQVNIQIYHERVFRIRPVNNRLHVAYTDKGYAILLLLLLAITRGLVSLYRFTVIQLSLHQTGEV